MANSIIMPKTGMAMEEGLIIEWRIREGDPVKKGDVVALIETDKSTMELESDYDGVILAILGKAGETVPVTQVIAWVGQPGEAIPADPRRTGTPAAPGVSADPSPAAAGTETSPGPTGHSAGPAAGGSTRTAAGEGAGKIRASPAARMLAKERGLDLASIAAGTDRELRRKDVEAALDAAVPATPLARRMAGAQGIDLGTIRGSGRRGRIFSADLDGAPAPPLRQSSIPPDTPVALTTIQRITGKRMSESRRTIPEVTENIRVDVTKLLALRQELNAQLAALDVPAKITVNDFMLSAAAKALGRHPRMNSVLAENELIYKGAVNLGMAVATGRGLLVPVLHHIQDMDLLEISAAASALAARAREGKLLPEEMSGGTFTVSNVGMYGIRSFTPIINPPEAGILGVCAVEDQLALEGERVVNRKKMGLSLAFDHRIVDGAEAAMFLKTLGDLLENPLLIAAL
jgi:pyruvate dehydrogenase E2 component (dihydrolipoamide acetyltransferase)